MQRVHDGFGVIVSVEGLERFVIPSDCQIYDNKHAPCLPTVDMKVTYFPRPDPYGSLYKAHVVRDASLTYLD